MKKIKSIECGKLLFNYLPYFILFSSITGIVLHFYINQLLLGNEIPTQDIRTFSKLTYVLYNIGIVLIAWFVKDEPLFKYLCHLVNIYILYCLISYFIKVTQNLNNSDFKLFNLIENRFFQSNFIWTIILILLCSFILKKSGEYLGSNLNLTFPRKMYSALTSNFILTGVILTDDLSYSIIIRLFSYHMSNNLFSLLINLLIYIILLVIVYVLFSYYFQKGVMDLVDNKVGIPVVVVSSFFFSLVFNYLLQYGVRKDEPLMDMFVFPAATAFQIILIFICSLIVYLIINRYILSTMLIISFWTIVSLVNIIKMSMRNEPMLVTDFSWIAHFSLLINVVEYKTIFIFILVIFSGLALFLMLHRKVLPGMIVTNGFIRSLLLSSIFLLLFGGYTVFRNERNRTIQDGIPIISQLNNNYNAFWLDLSYHARYRSLLFVWIKQLTKEAMEKPSNYNKNSIIEIVEKYQMLAQEMNQNRTEKLSDQTVIFILSESYSNPSKLEGITISKDIATNISSIMALNTSGTMRSDGYGGGTANMEWQSLVGLPMYNMSESISTITTEIIPRMDIIPSISDYFSSNNRIVIHLGDATTYSRKNFYNILGFKRFIADTNGTQKVTDYSRLGFFPSDESTYKLILDSIDESKNQFFSVITYQNHTPYSQSEPEDIIANGTLLSKDENDALTSYARLINYTDIETQKFLDVLQNMHQKITVVFYGDHLPGLYPSSQFDSNPEAQYETEYFIWSNYQTKKVEMPYLNSSDFPAAILAHTNSKVSPYYALLTKVLQTMRMESGEGLEEQEVANDLFLIEYDLISGKKYLKEFDNFFNVVE